MKKSLTTLVSLKARKAILRMVQRDQALRTTKVLEEGAQRAETAVRRLAQSRRDAQRRNEHLLAQKASV